MRWQLKPIASFWEIWRQHAIHARIGVLKPARGLPGKETFNCQLPAVRQSFPEIFPAWQVEQGDIPKVPPSGGASFPESRRTGAPFDSSVMGWGRRGKILLETRRSLPVKDRRFRGEMKDSHPARRSLRPFCPVLEFQTIERGAADGNQANMRCPGPAAAGVVPGVHLTKRPVSRLDLVHQTCWPPACPESFCFNRLPRSRSLPNP